MKKSILILVGFLTLTACGNTQKETGKSEQEQSNEVVIKEEYYPGGALKMRGKKRGDKRIGKWESYYPSGYRWSEMNYVEGYREGPAVSYYPNGMMRYQGRYYNDERSGIWMFYDTAGYRIKKIDIDRNESIPDSLLFGK